MTKANMFCLESRFVNSSTLRNRTIRSPQVSSELLAKASVSVEPSVVAVTGKTHKPAIVAIAAMTIVTMNTAVMMPMVLPRRLLSSMFAIEEEMAKKSSGITDTKRRFRKISPIGLSISTDSGKKHSGQTSK